MGPVEEKPHERLDRLMNLRRLALPKIDGRSVKWFQVAELAGVTVTTLNDVRKGKTNPSEDTQRGIEDALRWAPGSIGAVLAGGEPTIIEGSEEAATADQVAAVDEDFRALVEAVRAEMREMRDQVSARLDGVEREIRELRAERDHREAG